MFNTSIFPPTTNLIKKLVLAFTILLSYSSPLISQSNASTSKKIVNFQQANLEQAQSVILDKEGNIYTLGTFRNSIVLGDRELKAAVYDDPFEYEDDNPIDIYVSKQTPNRDFLWVSHFQGGDNGNTGEALEIDVDGNIMITGVFYDSLRYEDQLFKCDGKSDYKFKLNKNGKLIWGQTSNETFNTSNIDLIERIKLYPNPFGSFLKLDINSIEENQANISIHDITGKEVFNIKNSFLRKGNNSIDLGNAFENKSTGVYLVNITLSNGKKYIERVVKNDK